MRKRKVWYVIADGGRARFVERDEQGAFRTISSFVSTDLHEASRDLVSDRPGRVQESATPSRHSVEPKTDPHEAAKEDFVRYVADQLQLEQNNFEEIVLVAPPRVLGQIRTMLAVHGPLVLRREGTLHSIPCLLYTSDAADDTP